MKSAALRRSSCNFGQGWDRERECRLWPSTTGCRSGGRRCARVIFGLASWRKELWLKRGEREDRREAAELNALTEGIIGAAIKLHRELGPGLLESAYEACLHFEPGQRLSGGLASRPSALTAFSALESSLLPRAGALFPGQRSKPVTVHFDWS